MKRTGVLAAVTPFLLLFLIHRQRDRRGKPRLSPVRSSEVVTRVLIISGQITPTTGKRSSVELQCNKGMLMYIVPQPGTYVMVRLSKNRGPYECANVDLYPEGAEPESSEKIGEYCLIQR